MLRLSLAVALWLLLSPAHADPVTITAVVSAATAVSEYWWVVQVVLVASAVYGTVEQRRKARAARARQRDEYNNRLEDRSVTVLTAAPPWRIIYGRPGPVGGAIVAIFQTDKTALDANGDTYVKPDGLKHLVVEIAHHSCQAINEVLIDGIAVGTLDSNGYATAGEFYKTPTYVKAYDVPAASFVDLPAAAIGIVSQVLTVGNGESQSVYPITSCTLTLGNTRLNNPEGGVATVMVELPNSFATVRIQKHLGSDTQTVDTYLSGLLPTEWDSSHRLRGATYAVITLDLEEPRFQGGPPNFTFDVSGCNTILDPRSSTTGYSENNALCIAHFLQAEWGYRVDTADIDSAMLIAAANACDELITLTIGATSTPNQPRYTLNGTFTDADSKEQVLADMADSMAGVVTNAGSWFIRAGVWTAPVLTLNDSDLAGLIEFQRTNTDYEDLFNGMRGLYVPRGQAVPVEFDSYSNAAFVTADGEELWESKDLPYTDNKARARNLCRIFVESNRLGQTITYPAKLGAIRLQPGDRVLVNNAENGLVNKAYRVVDWQMSLATAVRLTLRHDEEASYDEADAASANPSSSSGLPNPWTVSTVTGVTVSSALRPQADGGLATAVTVAWNALTSAYVAQGGWVRVRWCRAADAQWVNADVTGDSRSSTFVGPPAGTLIVVGVLAENSNRARGPEEFVTHTLPALAFGSGTLSLVANGLTNALSIFGNRVARVSGASGWNAGFYSAAPIYDGCRLSFIVPRADRDVVIGLNTDPSTDAGYATIDYMLNVTSGAALRVWESGTQIGADVAFTPGTPLAIEYDGALVRYYAGSTLLRQVGAPPGLALYVDGSIFADGGTVQGIRFESLSPAQSGNLVDARSWVVGTTGSQGVAGTPGRFLAVGDSGENSVVLAQAVDGAHRPTWRAVYASATDNADGGFYAGPVAISHKQMYRFAHWVRLEAAAGTMGTHYHGPGFQVVRDMAGTLVDFAYFSATARSALVVGRPYLFVGYVFPSTYAGAQLTLSGIWDGRTGQKVASGTDYKWVDGQASAEYRAFLYGSSSGNSDLIEPPRLEMVDGAEPTIDQLLAPALQRVNAPGRDLISSLGWNGQFSDWAIGNVAPDGWSVWGSPSSSITKETAITRTGPNAVRVVAAAADIGISRGTTFTARPVAGSYLRVSVDLYIVTHTSGNKPNVLVRLYTNAGLTTYRDTNLQPGATTTGAWQSLAANCSVLPSEEIYRVEVYLQGSWGSAPGGAWTGTVIYDSLVADMMSPADTGTISPSAATEVFTPNTAAGTFPKGSGTVRKLIDGIVFTPAVDSTAEIVVTIDATATGSSGSEWGGSEICVACIPTANLTDNGDNTYAPDTSSTWTTWTKSKQGASLTRSSYTLTARFAVTAGTQYRCGAGLRGQSPDIGINFTVNAESAPLTNLTLIKR